MRNTPLIHLVEVALLASKNWIVLKQQLLFQTNSIAGIVTGDYI